ncbi:DUF4915 domain-containing protein [Gracilimonas mengyeensis]|uniref:Conserved hypothetical protein CHP03032 domain-containing protein n=1 Tax=Gracilimonas mengyeensis TaxID=1302730 RepID=A0A521FLD5_9BACT|nr:DUF4915 domain-containing protein [Gracilimonas mengyeensis]SMO97043.1 protein of unknown function [Gracilimonas mengyeensis]
MEVQHNLLILGSQNAKEEDQKLKRSQVKPVQIMYKDENIEPVSFFDDWGEVGVSSIAWPQKFKDELFVSVNDEIRRLNVKSKSWKTLDLGTVGDIHDIHFLDDLLWISNTEYDEAIGYDAEKAEVVKRLSLDEFRTEKEWAQGGEEFEKIKDRFHCNQVFKNYAGETCVLIHTINGWLFYRMLFEMLVKQQGEGGVINLDTKEVIPLKLQSPHSVRKINGNYWIQDSSDLSVKIYDKEWNLIDSIKTGGFGRGADFSEEANRAYIGLSATRKRYLKIIPTSEYHSNRVMVTDIKKRKKIKEVPVPNIEQMDNVYILNEQMLEVFESLK